MTETVFWILTSLAEGRRHGYAVLSDVERLSGGTVVLRVTTLYASLERLERNGSIHSAGDEVVDGRARRYYEITAEGGQALLAEAARLAARSAIAISRASAPRPAAALAVGA